MSCSQTLTSIPKDCLPNMGGVRRVFVGNFEDFVATLTEDNNTVRITTIAVAEGAEGSPKLAKYDFPRGLASMTSTATIEPTSGAKYFTTEVALQFNRMEATKRLEVMALLMADTMVIVEDENGKLWLLDNENPANVSASDGTTGTAVGDANKYGVTLQVMAKELPYEVLRENIYGDKTADPEVPPLYD